MVTHHVYKLYKIVTCRGAWEYTKVNKADYYDDIHILEVAAINILTIGSQ